MPGWHQQTEQLVAEGKLSVMGIVQEQHPDRAALYMRWQQMDWPVLADPYNDLGISAVPITLLIDQHGVIRYRNPKPKELKKFLAEDYANTSRVQRVDLLPKAIDSLEGILAEDPKNALAHFRLGVAYRMRFDSDKREVEDFAQAVSHWERALALRPNQYIWRRRIQQYGPRLDKPYSFYDWVNNARQEITQRGERPPALIAEPSGAELAVPSRSSGDAGKQKTFPPKHPDPEGQIVRDTGGLVLSRVVTVASTNKKKPAVRVHLTFQLGSNTTWTNEAGNISFHFASGAPVQIEDLKLPILPSEDSSRENRVIEFEVHPREGGSLPESIKGAAFYYVCDQGDNSCRFLRQDMVIPLIAE